MLSTIFNRLAPAVSTPMSTASPGAPRAIVTPAIDVRETATTVELTADLPGVRQDGVEVTVAQGVLTLRGRSAVTTPTGFDCVGAEYGHYDYERSFTVGRSIDAERISARIAHGVLTVTLPKVTAAQERKIPVLN